jgi:hypothetical protein
MEKAEMQRLIGELLVENIMKDRQIEDLEWDKDYYIDKIDNLEYLIKRMGQEEEEALEKINKASLSTLPFTEAAVDKAIDLATEILEDPYLEQCGEYSRLKDHLPVLGKALGRILDLKLDINGATSVLFSMRHYYLKTNGAKDLLAEKPARCFPKERDSEREAEDSMGEETDLGGEETDSSTAKGDSSGSEDDSGEKNDDEREDDSKQDAPSRKRKREPDEKDPAAPHKEAAHKRIKSSDAKPRTTS